MKTESQPSRLFDLGGGWKMEIGPRESGRVLIKITHNTSNQFDWMMSPKDAQEIAYEIAACIPMALKMYGKKTKNKLWRKLLP